MNKRLPQGSLYSFRTFPGQGIPVAKGVAGVMGILFWLFSVRVLEYVAHTVTLFSKEGRLPMQGAFSFF